MAQAIVTVSTVKTPVERAKELIAQHQLIAFFALAYVFTWTIWFLIPQTNAFSTLGFFGPAVAAVVISAIIAPETVNGSRARRWALFALAFVVALSVWLLLDWRLQAGRGWLPGAVCAALVAYLVSGPLAGHRGVRDLLGPLASWRVGWFSYAAALLLLPAIVLLGAGLDIALGGQLPPWPRGEPSFELVLVTFAWVLFAGGFTEEPGWRGFALPKLQSRYSPLVASVILAFVWAFWHAPLYFTGVSTGASNDGPASVVGILTRPIWMVPATIIITWLYNRSRRSLLIVILLHTAFDTAGQLVPLSPRASVLGMVGIMWAIALLVVVTGRMWRKLQPDEPLARAPA